MTSLRETKSRYAKYYCDLVQQYIASGNGERIKVEYENILRGVEIAEEEKDYSMLADYVEAVGIGNIWFPWDKYKHLAYLIIENNSDANQKIKLLTNLAAIEKNQGNYHQARKLYEEKIEYIAVLDDPKDSHHLFDVARQILEIAKHQSDFENLESILLNVLEVAINQNDAKQQVDILLELTLLPDVKNNLRKAIEYSVRGLKLADMMGYKIGVIDLFKARASIYLLHDNFIEAMSTYKMAWELALAVNDKYRTNEIRKQLDFLGEFMNKKVFISYNNADRNFVEKLASDLQIAGFSVWWDEWEIKVGDSIIQKVSSGIATSARLIVVLSPFSVNSSWVQREIGSALMNQLSNEKGIAILPLLLADCDIPVLLREIRWADFRKSYELGLKELRKALK
jgi:hypothetical protein